MRKVKFKELGCSRAGSGKQLAQEFKQSKKILPKLPRETRIPLVVLAVMSLLKYILLQAI